MMTVRFPNGQAVTYNNARQLKYTEGAWHLYSDHAMTKWIVSIQLSSGCIIESVSPCRVENSTQIQTLESAANMVLENIRYVPPRIANKIKAELESFNRQTWKWK